MAQTKMLTPDEIKSLSERLGSNADAAISRFNTKPNTSKRGRPANVVENPLKEKIATIWNHCHVNGLTAPGWLDDLITGASRSNAGDKYPLNRGNILKCLSQLDFISSATVASRLRISEPMARKIRSSYQVDLSKTQESRRR